MASLIHLTVFLFLPLVQPLDGVPDLTYRADPNYQLRNRAMTIPPPQLAALKALYVATGGDQWKINTGWNDPNADPCQWHGVGCDAVNGVVQQVILSSNNLVGTIPPELG